MLSMTEKIKIQMTYSQSGRRKNKPIKDHSEYYATEQCKHAEAILGNLVMR